MTVRVATERLDLVACASDVIRASLEDPSRAGALLEASVPSDWPSEDLHDALPIFLRQAQEDPDGIVWGAWVMILRDERIVVGDIGFKGPPDAAGRVEIGYGVVSAFRRQGFAVEAARALVEWAFVNGARTVTAECVADNIGSVLVLERIGMRRTGTDGDLIRWSVSAAASPSPG
ncbi:MAG TPA: GNAT family N-acetyltransferase [Actinomycetota bacterium]|nr:GNAT family N-acetyltransferase [Actinomycetota bacterium]